MSFTGLDRYRIMLDGVDDYIDCGDIDGLDGASALTISVWVNFPDNIGTDDNFIFSKRLDDNNKIQMYISDESPSQLYFDLSNGGAKYGKVQVTTAAEQQWWNFVMVFDGSFTDGDAGVQNAGRLKAYYNAAPLTLTFTGTIATTTADCGANTIQIGRESSSSDNMYGIISQVAIWNTALTSEEVTTLYDGGTRHSDWSTMQKSNQVAHWRFKTNDIGYGKHLDFDGTDEYLLIADGIPDSTDSFSVAAWFNCDILGENSDIFSMQGSSGNEAFRMYTQTDNKLGFQLTPASDTRVYPETTSTEVIVGNWVHYVGTFSEGKFNQYVNGSLAAVEQDYSGTFTDVKAGWTTATIGSKNNTPDNEFNGKIEQISIWNTVLAPHRVARMYLEGRHSNWQTNFSIGMSGYWRMGDGTDDNFPTVIVDQVGSNDATPQNMESADEIYSLTLQDILLEEDTHFPSFSSDDPSSTHGLGINLYDISTFEDNILNPNGSSPFQETLTDTAIAEHNTVNPLTGLGDCMITVGSAGTGGIFIPRSLHADYHTFFFKLSFNYRVVSGEMRVSVGGTDLWTPQTDWAIFSDRTETTKTRFEEYFYYSSAPGHPINVWFSDDGGGSVYHIDDISLNAIWPLNQSGEGFNIEDTDIELDAIPVDETGTQPASGWQSTIYGYFLANNDEIRSADAPT